MKAITVWQPWAGALAAGIKGNETRSWATKYRGPIAIHSAMKAIHHTWSNLYMDDKAREVICRRLELPEIIDGPATFPMGCILATAELVDCIRITPEYITTLTPDELALGDYTLGPVCVEAGERPTAAGADTGKRKAGALELGGVPTTKA